MEGLEPHAWLKYVSGCLNWLQSTTPTTPHHTTPHHTTPHHTTPYHTNHTTPHHTTPHHTTPTTPHHTIPHQPHHTTPHHTTPHYINYTTRPQYQQQGVKRGMVVDDVDGVPQLPPACSSLTLQSQHAIEVTVTRKLLAVLSELTQVGVVGD